ncbi:MAG: hypothetical protein AAFN93_00700 [Bacteroidota bacterium]
MKDIQMPEYLYHYYELENGPFRNITRNKLERAKEIQNSISVGINSKRPPNYIELRFALEKRLKDAFTIKGGQPTRDDPFYFTLGECDWLKSMYSNPGVVKIPLANLDFKYLTFTYPDSMVSFQFGDEPKLATYRKEVNGKVFLFDEIEKEIISKYGIPSQEKWESDESMKYDRYIEAQLWDDAIIAEFQKLDFLDAKHQKTDENNPSTERIDVEFNKLTPEIKKDSLNR